MPRQRKEPQGQLYRLKDNAPPHFIGGVIVTDKSAPFELPEGVKPGKFLVEFGKKASEPSGE